MSRLDALIAILEILEGIPRADARRVLSVLDHMDRWDQLKVILDHPQEAPAP